jgi:hypothetical protein
MVLFTVSSTQFLCASILIFGIGFTLIKYSRDGDNENRIKNLKTAYADEKKTTEKEAWDHLRNLANYPLVEVTWNVFMFIAIVSTMSFLGLAGKMISEATSSSSSSYSFNNFNPDPISTITNNPLNPITNTKPWIGAISLLFGLIVFSLQDLVHKWRNAHRRHPLVKEMNDIMDRLQYQYNTPLQQQQQTQQHQHQQH